MSRAAVRIGNGLTIGNAADLHMDDVDSFVQELSSRLTAEFDAARPIFVARAPGRLDVMGGIADYSGSLVLQMPIAEATFAAAQLHSEASKKVVATSDNHSRPCQVPLAKLFGAAGGEPTPLAELRDYFKGLPEDERWAAYVVGVLGVLAHEPETRSAVQAINGCSILVKSAVPEGKGVSSSAAVEVATMMAVLGALGVTISPPERIAQLCQRVENFVVGAPCGIMDQMASALGCESRLLALVCQPHTVEAPVAIPEHLTFWGIDSGVRHSVGGSDYGSVRTATFMGRAALRAALQERAERAADAPELALPAELTRLEHLVALSPSLLAELEPCLPRKMRGRDFLDAFGSKLMALEPWPLAASAHSTRVRDLAATAHGDEATTVVDEQRYDLRRCAAHPVREHFRVRAFRQLLAAPPSEEQLVSLGELMYQSHESYSSVGLGCDATDKLVQLVRSLGPASGLYGAKITGGGSGGTVCVLGASTAAASDSLAKVVAAYEKSSGHAPHVFSGSSAGAVAFGHLEVIQGAAPAQSGGRGKGKKRSR